MVHFKAALRSIPLLLAAATCAGAQEQLELRISTDKIQYVMSEPVGITLRVLNPTDHAITAYLIPNRGDSSTLPCFYVEGEDGRSFQYDPSWAAILLAPAPIRQSIQPGETWWRRGYVYSTRKQGSGKNRGPLQTFPRPGRYKIRAKAIVGQQIGEGRMVESNGVQITIAGAGGPDPGALEFLRVNELEPALIYEEYVTPDNEPKVLEFLSTHGRSTYAPFLRVTYGAYLIGGLTEPRGGLDREQIARGSALLDEVTKDKDHPIAGEALFFQGLAQQRLGNVAESKRCLKAAIESSRSRYGAWAQSHLYSIEAQEEK